MARSRQKVDPRFSPVITRPTAGPVDTYARPAPSGASQLAAALAEVDPKLQRFSQVLSENYVNEQRAEGEQAARVHSERALQAGELTSQGKLPMQDNPYYMQGYKEEWGRVSAGVWQSDFKAVMEQDPALKESTDMADFDKAVGGHLDSWFKDKNFERDAAFEKGFGHMKDQYVAMARLGFAEGIEHKLDKKSDEALFAMVKRSISDNWGSVAPEAIAKDIDLITGNWVLRGRPEGKARTAATLAIAAAAKEMGPEKGLEVIKLLEKAQGEGGKGKLSDQSYGSKALQETKKDLIVESQQAAEAMREEKARARKERVDGIVTEATKVLAKNPNANLEKLLADNPDFPPESVGALRQLQTEWQGVAYTTNQVIYRDLFNRIWFPKDGEDPTSIAEIVSKSRNKNLKPDDAYQLISMFETMKGKKKEDLIDDRVKFYWDEAYKRLENNFKDKLTGFVQGENVERVHNSHSLLMKFWLDLKTSGNADKMDHEQLNKWFLNTSKDIIGLQQSELQGSLKFDPPPTPPIGKQDKEAGKIPEAPVLTPQDLRDFRSGKTDKVKRLMKQFGITPDRAQEFLADQYKKLGAGK